MTKFALACKKSTPDFHHRARRGRLRGVLRRPAVAAGVLALAGLAAGCIVLPGHTWERVPVAQDQVGSNSLDRIAVGDTLRVRTKRDNVLLFRVEELRATSFLGIGEDGKRYNVPYQALTRIEVRRPDPQAVRLPLFGPR